MNIDELMISGLDSLIWMVGTAIIFMILGLIFSDVFMVVMPIASLSVFVMKTFIDFKKKDANSSKGEENGK